MTIAWFLMGRDTPANGDAARTWATETVVPVVTALPAVQSVDYFTPERAADPYLDDGSGPVFMLQVDFPDVASAEKALVDERLGRTIGSGNGRPEALTLGHDLLETMAFPVGDQERPQPRTAPLSYIVRYHRPAEDEVAFIRHYVERHPPILGEFPDIRNVFCYTPVDWTDPLGLPQEDLMLGNEVVFASLEALNASLASDVRHKLREDYNTFPPFTGRNTHHAMMRRTLFPET